MYRAATAAALAVRRCSSKKEIWDGRMITASNCMAKGISSGVGTRAAMLQGVDELPAAVEVTKGPEGRAMIIEESNGSPKVTKDDITVAKSIEVKEKAKNVGANLVKQVSKATNKADGRTCATVLTQAILAEGCKAVAAGVNVMDLRRGIKMGIDAVLSHLKNRALMIVTPEEINQVATIYADGDEEIGELIAKAMEKVGKEGVITVSNGNTLYSKLHVVEGIKLGRGYISSYACIKDCKTGKREIKNPLILIHDKMISDVDSLLPALELAVKANRSLVIVALHVENICFFTLPLYKRPVGLQVCAIEAPRFGVNRRENLDDLAILTGGRVVTEDRGLTLDKVQLEMLGTAKKVTVSLDDTIILYGGGGDKRQIEERRAELRTTMVESKAVFDKEQAQERLSKLSGGVAIIKIGGTSKAEVSKRKDRVADALNATRVAVEEGIVPGGGVALLYATKELDKIQTSNSDEKIGVQIIKDALKTPILTIAANAGVDGSVVVGRLLEQDDLNFGYDAAKGEYVDMVKAGIIDPVKVIKTALVNAASVSMLLTDNKSNNS